MLVLLGIDGVGEHNEFAFFFFKVLYYTILYKKSSQRKLALCWWVPEED